MKKACLMFGCILAVVGLALSSLGLRMGGQTTASVHLFGRTWHMNAPFSGGGYGVFDRSDNPTPSPSYYAASSVPIEAVDYATQAPLVEEYNITGITDESGTPFNSIDLEVEFGNVAITAGNDFCVTISCDGSDYRVNHWYKNDVLYIESNDDLNFSAFAKQHSCDIIIEVPEGVSLDLLRADLGLGNLTLSSLDIHDAELDLDLGDLTGENLTVRGMLEADVDLGRVCLIGELGEFTKIDADLGSVDLNLTNSASDYGWDLTADLGSIDVNGRFRASNTNLTGGNGNHMIIVDADLGNITVEFEQAQASSSPPSVDVIGETAYLFEGGKAAQSTDIGVETAP